MERSVMDEASSEASRCQIAALEREKNEWLKRKQGSREEVEADETLKEQVERLRLPQQESALESRDCQDCVSFEFFLNIYLSYHILTFQVAEEEKWYRW